LKPFLRGIDVFKRLNSNSSLNLKNVEFDPVRMTHPEKEGYGIRHMRINEKLDKIEFRQPYKSYTDSWVKVKDILRVNIHSGAQKVLKMFQKYKNKVAK